MNTLLYVAMLIGIGWLMLWASLPRPYRGRGWFPFDMAQDADVRTRDELPPPTPGPHRSWRNRTRPSRDGRRR